MNSFCRYIDRWRGYMVDMGRHRHRLGGCTKTKESNGKRAGTQRYSTSLPRHCMATALRCFRSRQTPICRLHKGNVCLRKSHSTRHCAHLSRAWFLQGERRFGPRGIVQCDESVFVARSRSWLLSGIWFHRGIVADAGKYCLFHGPLTLEILSPVIPHFRCPKKKHLPFWFK